MTSKKRKDDSDGDGDGSDGGDRTRAARGPIPDWLDLEGISRLVGLVAEHNLSELKLEVSGVELSIKRGGAGPGPGYGDSGHVPSLGVPAPTGAFGPGGAAPAAPTGPPAGAPEAPRAAPSPNLFTVSSPFVGTFYRAPGPERPSFASVGQRVKKGDVLCIVEAMKLMNEIESDMDGTVVEILVGNAEPVEYGQALFKIQP